MGKLIKSASAVILFLSAVCNAHAFLSSQDTGTAAAQFLKLGIGAKNAAMGNASVSNLCGSDAVYWNPANLAPIEQKTVSFSHTAWFENINYEWVSFAVPFEKNGTLAVALQYVSYGTMDKINSYAVTEGTFSPADTALYLSYARSYGSLQFGANLKYINCKIDNSASAFAVDLGTNFDLSDGKTSVAAAVSNIGTNIKFNNESEKLPVLLKTGISSYVTDNLLLAFDLNFPNDNDLYFNAGGEYLFSLSSQTDFFLRAGYDGRNKDIPGLNWLNTGFGINYMDFSFDYAFVPYGDLGMTHRFSFSVKFGEVVKK